MSLHEPARERRRGLRSLQESVNTRTSGGHVAIVIVALVGFERNLIRAPTRDGALRESAVGLVLNVVVLWNTFCMEAPLLQLRNQGNEANGEDVERLSPLGYEHISLLRRYSFALAESVARGELRPPRNPEEEDE